jgi:hypothetical protein
MKIKMKITDCNRKRYSQDGTVNKRMQKSLKYFQEEETLLQWDIDGIDIFHQLDTIWALKVEGSADEFANLSLYGMVMEANAFIMIRKQIAIEFAEDNINRMQMRAIKAKLIENKNCDNWLMKKRNGKYFMCNQDCIQEQLKELLPLYQYKPPYSGQSWKIGFMRVVVIFESTNKVELPMKYIVPKEKYYIYSCNWYMQCYDDEGDKFEYENVEERMLEDICSPTCIIMMKASILKSFNIEFMEKHVSKRYFHKDDDEYFLNIGKKHRNARL